jgi:hypothetical protein
MVLSASKGNVTIKSLYTKRATTGGVLVSFDCDGNQSSVGAMKSGTSLSTTSELHESAVFAAVRACVQARLSMSPVDVIKTGVMCVHGHIIGGRGSIGMCVPPNATGVRKALVGFVASLAIPKLYASYARYTRNVGEPPNKEYFNHACSNLLNNIKKADILVTGKVKVKKEKLQDVVDAVAKAWNKIPSISDKKSAPKVEKASVNDRKSKHTTTSIPKGVGCFILKSHILKKMPGVHVSFEGKNMVVDCTESQLQSAADKKRTSEHAAKLEAVVKRFGIEAIIHVAASHACGDAAELASDASKTWNKSSLTFSA